MRSTRYPYLQLLLCLFVCGGFGALSAQTNPCDFSGGALTIEDGGRVFRVCLDDGTEGLTNVIRTGFEGGEEQWFITTSGGVILEIPTGGPPFDLTAYGERTLAIWSVAYSGELIDIAPGDNVCSSAATECFDLSNSVVIDRNTGEDCDAPCDALGGTLALADGSGTQDTICIDDGAASAVDVAVSGEVVGDNTTFVITDDTGNILAIPDGSGPFDLSVAGTGTCIIWHLAYDDGFEGLEVGGSVDDFEGCFNLSNGVSVVRQSGDDCPAGMDFTATLSGVHEIPVPVTSTGNGSVQVRMRGTTVTVSGSFSGLVSDFDPTVDGGAHLHLGYAGQAGPIAVSLTTTLDADSRGGSFAAADNTFTVTAEQAAAIAARGMYVNIHSVTYPAGEIRGQVVPAGADAYARAYLLGVNEAPSVVTLAVGGVVAERTGNELTISGSFSGLSADIATAVAGGAHVHTGVVGRNGPISFPLTMDIGADNRSAVFRADANTYTLTEEQLQAMAAYGLYVNVHSLNNPGGEVRGQITPMSTASFSADLSGHQARPAPINTQGNGRVQLNLTGNTLELFGSVGDLSAPVLLSLNGGAHLHPGLPGQSGGIDFAMSLTPDDGANGGVWSAANNSFTLTDEQVTTLLDRGYYVNVHTEPNRGGEARGQVMNLAKGYVGSNVNGINAKPTANQTTGNGFLMYEITDNSLTAIGSFADLTSDYDSQIGSHIHVADASRVGPVVYDLTPTLGDDLRAGTYTAADNTIALRNGNRRAILLERYYFNLPTVAYPSGEIRGQLLREDNAFPEPVVVNEPAEGDTIRLFSGSSDPQPGAFDPGVDPDGNLQVFTVEIASVPDFPVMANQLYTIGRDSNVARQFGEIYDTLIARGAFPGLELPLRYRVFAGDGSVNTPTAYRNVVFDLVGGDNPDCPADGGVIAIVDNASDTITICAGDGEPDDFNVTVTDSVGSNYVFVITDTAGMILDITAEQPFDLEGAGAGLCLVWGLAYEDGITGAEIGANANNLGGCFGLSNPVYVERLTGLDCAGPACAYTGGSISVDGIENNTTAICVGDGEPDPLVVEVEGAVGDSSTLVITDVNLQIIAIPPADTVDLEGAGVGTCLIWNVTYNTETIGLDVGANAAQLAGCFGLSNFITVIRDSTTSCMDGIVAGEVEINEVFAGGEVELRNNSATSVNLNDLYITSSLGTYSLADVPVSCGEGTIKVGEIAVVDLANFLRIAGDELVLSTAPLVGGLNMLSYVRWNDGGTTLTRLATVLGLWVEGTELAAPTPGLSIQLDPDADTPVYGLFTPTPCAANEASVSTNVPSAGDRLSVFPNPFNGSITLEVEGLKANRTQLQLIDINGRIVTNRILAFRSGRLAIEATQLPAGTYVLRLTNTYGVSTRRVIKR